MNRSGLATRFQRNVTELLEAVVALQTDPGGKTIAVIFNPAQFPSVVGWEISAEVTTGSGTTKIVCGLRPVQRRHGEADVSMPG